jgi:hypothetical protein
MMVWLWVLVIGFVVLVGGMIGGVVVCCVGCGFCGMFGVVLVGGMVVGFVACCLCCGGCCLEEENSTKHSVGRPNYIEIRKKSTKVKIECAAIISKIRSVYVMVTPDSGKSPKNE